MSLPLTTQVLNELLEMNTVVEVGHAASTGGRRPILYSLRPDVMYVVAVAMDQLFTRIVIMDMQKNYAGDVEIFELHLAGNPEALSILEGKIEDVIESSGMEKDKVAGIGIGMPGFVDAKKGVNYSFLDAGNGSITRRIKDKMGLKAFIENDSTLIAMAEFRFGAARKRQDAMVVNLGWGTGLGMILNGELIRGHNGFAGEFSHLPIFANNKLCTCGKMGCLETEASLLAVMQKAQEGIGNGRTSILKDLSKVDFDKASWAVIHAAEKGDQFAVGLLTDAGYHIGRGIAILIHLLNPEAVILSGRGSSAGKIWKISIQQALNEHCIPRLAAGTDIEISALGYGAELLGAAALVMDHYGS